MSSVPSFCPGRSQDFVNGRARTRVQGVLKGFPLKVWVASSRRQLPHLRILLISVISMIYIVLMDLMILMITHRYMVRSGLRFEGVHSVLCCARCSSSEAVRFSEGSGPSSGRGGPLTERSTAIVLCTDSIRYDACGRAIRKDFMSDLAGKKLNCVRDKKQAARQPEKEKQREGDPSLHGGTRILGMISSE